jgi:uncharacterized membrane protein YccC
MTMRRFLLVILFDSFIDALLAVLIVFMWRYFARRSAPEPDIVLNRTVENLHRLIDDYRTQRLNDETTRNITRDIIARLYKTLDDLKAENAALRGQLTPLENTNENTAG